ncbi:hypothetical protein MP638_007392 [Amoeboaphelidium occidentale]|nr:hypothetical protein MP638_007392 [Amoeboaphelidium occidentale]
MSQIDVVLMIYVWNAVNVAVLIILFAAVAAHTIVTKGSLLNRLNIHLFTTIFGWAMSCVADTMSITNTLPYLPFVPFVAYLGAAMTMISYMLFVIARTETLTDNFFTSFKKPIRYIFRTFCVISAFPLLLTFAANFLDLETSMTMIRSAAFVNVFNGLLIILFDILCGWMFYRLNRMIAQKSVVSEQYSIIGRYGLYSSLSLLVSISAFAFTNAINFADSYVGLLVCKSSAILVAVFMLRMKIELQRIHCESNAPSTTVTDKLTSNAQPNSEIITKSAIEGNRTRSATSNDLGSDDNLISQV